MISALRSCAELRSYRWISIPLLLASSFIPLTAAQWFGWGLLGMALGLPFYGTLALITYWRLQDACYSSAWLIPMILIFHFGPKWEVGPLDIHPSGLISLIPVVIGWFAPSRRTEGLDPALAE